MLACDCSSCASPPWQNGYAERLIGTVRRECLDRLLIFGESHLRRVLASYAVYYNHTRTHLALQKDAPLHRAVQPSGVIVAIPILSGLPTNTSGYDFRERITCVHGLGSLCTTTHARSAQEVEQKQSNLMPLFARS